VSVGERIFAGVYDRLMAGEEKAGLAELRKRVVGQAAGRVLEIGGGTGANLPYYGSNVEALTITEPAEPMARRLEGKLREQPVTADVMRAPAEQLPFEDDSFDTAVSTLVLCTVDDQDRSLGELRRVLKPGGQLLFIEHVRSDSPRQARWQDRVNPVHRVIGCGCNCNRDTLARIKAADFAVGELANDRLHKAPPWVRPLIVGVAQARA
jgi:ubiquinone/menaquinone biosynthesis C-methylase UbiE